MGSYPIFHGILMGYEWDLKDTDGHKKNPTHGRPDFDS